MGDIGRLAADQQPGDWALRWAESKWIQERRGREAGWPAREHTEMVTRTRARAGVTLSLSCWGHDWASPWSLSVSWGFSGPGLPAGPIHAAGTAVSWVPEGRSYAESADAWGRTVPRAERMAL